MSSPDIREAITEYFAARDKLRDAHEARLAVGTDWTALNSRMENAEAAVRVLLDQPASKPDDAGGKDALASAASAVLPEVLDGATVEVGIERWTRLRAILHELGYPK